MYVSAMIGSTKAAESQWQLWVEKVWVMLCVCETARAPMECGKSFWINKQAAAYYLVSETIL